MDEEEVKYAVDVQGEESMSIQDSKGGYLGILKRSEKNTSIWHLRDSNGHLIDWGKYKNDILERNNIKTNIPRWY